MVVSLTVRLIRIHTVLTDNDMAVADLPQNRNGPTQRYLGTNIFNRRPGRWPRT